MATSAATPCALSTPSSALADGGRTLTAVLPKRISLPSLPAPPPLPTREARRPLTYCRKIARNMIFKATGDSVATTEALASADSVTSAITADVTTETTDSTTTETTEVTTAETTEVTTAETTNVTTAETTNVTSTETTEVTTSETTIADVTTETTEVTTTETTEVTTSDTTEATTAGTTDQVTTELPEIVKTLQKTWDKVEDKYTVSSLAVAGFVGLVGAAGTISAIDRLPLVPGLLEVVGIGYTGWFAYKNLVTKTNREALFAKVKSAYNDILGSD